MNNPVGGRQAVHLLPAGRCAVTTYTFPGYVPYLENAARQLGCAAAAGPARRISALSELANLCAQVSIGNPSHATAIMAKAEEFRDQLHTACFAADLMIDELYQALGIAQSRKKVGRPRRSTAAARRPARRERL
jgi:hypothetical protein